MSAAGSHHVLRRALVGGYRVADVEVALAELRFALAHLELEVQAASSSRTVSEQTVTQLRRELAAAQEHVTEVDEALRSLRRERDGVAESAQRSVAAAQAQAFEARAQAADALRFRDELSKTLSGLAEQLRTGVRPAASGRAARAAAVRRRTSSVRSSSSTPARSASSQTCVLFEHALRELPNVTDVYLRQFEQERAQVEVSVAQPVRLVEDIAARLPFSVDVTPGDGGHATLTVYPVAHEA